MHLILSVSARPKLNQNILKKLLGMPNWKEVLLQQNYC